VLEVQQSRGWHDIVTLDESWFYFSTDHERIWLAPGEKVPDRERHMIQCPKMTITIVWNPSGFHIVTALPKGLKFNACYYTREILQEIKNWREQQGVGGGRKLCVYSDNARLHTAKLSMDFLNANGMKKAPHPPYSPDLAPTDSFLFGDVKRQLNGYSFNSAVDLLTAVHHILDGYDRSTLISVFEEWMRRLRQCIDAEREYVE
jgi:histone-lysine N-methyltransferase SETMAR